MKSSPPSILDHSVIPTAVEHLRKGELVAFPTETVYGLGADASSDMALRKLYATKGRPGEHPVIVHLASFEQMGDWCIELPDYAKLLAQQFWPGPLTLIVKKAKHVSPLITGGQDTVGLRVPAHPIALLLLKAFGGGIAAPSANKYGRISATCAEHVQQEFGDEVSMIIDGGSCPVGIESTIVDATGSRPRILRPGVISEKELFEQIGLELDGGTSSWQSSRLNSGKHIRVPGSDKSHYAPRTPMLLLDKNGLKSLLAHRQRKVKSSKSLSYAVLAFTDRDQLTVNAISDNDSRSSIIEYIHASLDVKTYARELYANLRTLDNSGANYILVEQPLESTEWIAVLDRLKRAATKL